MGSGVVEVRDPPVDDYCQRICLSVCVPSGCQTDSEDG